MDPYYVYRVLSAVAPRIPPARGRRLAGWLGGLVYARAGKALDGLRDNIQHALGIASPPEALDLAARRAYRILCQNYYDLFYLSSLSAERLQEAVEVDDWHVVEEASRLGRGVVLCSGHLGHPEAALQIAAAQGLPVLAPAEHLRPERLYQYACELRSRHGMRLVPSDGPLLELFRTLRRGEAVGLAIDRDTTGSGIEVPLCGKLAHLPDGYAQIAAKTGAVLVGGFCYWLPGGRVRTEMGPIFVPQTGRANRRAVYEAALDFGVRVLANAITAHPDQWVLTTPIWTAEPTAEASRGARGPRPVALQSSSRDPGH